MLGLALEIVRKRREYIICGSLGMIYLDVIPIRVVHDLDFICPKSKFNSRLPTYGNYGPLENEGYLCYKISGDGGFYYNVFVFEDDDYVKTVSKDGTRFQDPEQMLHFKRIYNRAKDKIDLANVSAEFLL
jgi:hypothetical protein